MIFKSGQTSCSLRVLTWMDPASSFSLFYPCRAQTWKESLGKNVNAPLIFLVQYCIKIKLFKKKKKGKCGFLQNNDCEMLEFFKQAIARSLLIYWCLSTSCDGSVWKEAGWEGAFTALCWPFVEIAFTSTPRQSRMKTSSLSHCSARTQVFSPNGYDAVIWCLYRGKRFLPSTLGHGSVIWIGDNEGYFFFPPTFHLLGWALLP